MARLNTYTCSICESIKKVTNHWWVGIASRLDGKVFGYSIIKWDDKAAASDEVDHLCGIECAVKWLGQKLDQLSK